MNKLDQYLGNPNLKKGHTKTRFTKKQVEGTVKNILSVHRDFFGRELEDTST